MYDPGMESDFGGQGTNQERPLQSLSSLECQGGCLPLWKICLEKPGKKPKMGGSRLGAHEDRERPVF
jgi:hypothetical protein